MAAPAPATPADSSPRNGKSGGPGSEGRFLGKCFKCVKVGHKSEKCWTKKSPDTANAVAEENAREKTSDFAFVSVDDVLAKMKGEELTQDIFIGDSATMSNMTNDKMQVYICISENGLVMVGTGESEKASIIGDLYVRVKKADGKEYAMTLTKVKYIPDFKVNLISLTRYMIEGWSLVSDAKMNISLTKGENIAT